MSSCGDGSIKVWDVAAPPASNPLRSYQEHSREVRTGLLGTQTAAVDCTSWLVLINTQALGQGL